MPNTLLTSQQVTRKALALFLNSNYLVKNVNRQYDDQFARDGAKIGTTLSIRLPNDYTVRNGPTWVPQNTNEITTPLKITTQKGVDVSFSSADRALSMDDYAERVLKPAMNKLSSAVALDIMSMVEGVPNLVSNVDNGGNVIAPVFDTFLAAGAILDQYGVPRGTDHRMILLDPQTQRRAVNSFSGFFNNQSEVGRQYKDGTMEMAAGFRYNMDQTVLKHPTAAYGAPPTVNGAGQSGTTLTVSALAGPVNQGETFTIAGVNSVNRSTNQDNGTLQQFVVTAPVAAGATSLPIYPPITPGLVQYQTVTASPANGAAIAFTVKAGQTIRKNIAMDPRAMTMACADLPLPTGAVMDCARASFGGVSMRMVTDYVFGSDQIGTRLDILYGYALIRPEWAVVVADAL